MTDIIVGKCKSRLERKNRIHTELYVCPLKDCGRMFKAQFSMKRHLMVHSQLKNYTCRFCDKTFTLPQYLREHECIHTKELPYICGVADCTLRFRQAGKLSLHRRAHPEYVTKKYDYSLNQQKRTKKRSKGSTILDSSKRDLCDNPNSIIDNKKERAFSHSTSEKQSEKMEPIIALLPSITSFHELSTTCEQQNYKVNNLVHKEINLNELESLMKFLYRICLTQSSFLPIKDNSLSTHELSSLDLFSLAKKVGDK